MNFDFALIQQEFADVEFFFVAIDLKALDRLHCSCDCLHFDAISQRDFFSISSKSPVYGNGLARLEGRDLVLFRGYELSTGIVSYQDRVSAGVAGRLENGVFAFVHFDLDNKLIRIRTDAFGISPIFVKQRDGIVLVSSHNVLLRSIDDEVDPVGELSTLNIGYSFGQHTVFSDIQRAPAGADLLIGLGECRAEQWIDYESLGRGSRLICQQAAQEVENSFRDAMERCLALAKFPLLLPLSSGYDSRRIFGFLKKSCQTFESITAQAYKKLRGEYYDIDGTFAPKVAEKFGVSNQLVLAASPQQLSADLAFRDGLLGSETLMHGWSFRLRQALIERSPSCIFDGLGGDALGNSGFEFVDFHKDYSRNPLILHRETTKSGVASALNYEEKTLTEYLSQYWDYLDNIPHNPNQCEIAFMLLRTRRSISPWILMTQSPRHLVFFPYLELGHVRKTLDFLPGEKYRVFFQRECLRRFYPDLFDMPGSRALPSILKPLQSSTRRQLINCERSYLFSQNVIEKIRERTSLKNNILFEINRVLSPSRSPRAWLFESLARYYRSEDRSGYFLTN